MLLLRYRKILDQRTSYSQSTCSTTRPFRLTNDLIHASILLAASLSSLFTDTDAETPNIPLDLKMGANMEVQRALVDTASLALNGEVDSVEFVKMAKIAFVDGMNTP